MSLWIWALLGCAGDYSVTYYADSCTDWDFDEDSEPRIVVERDEGDILVIRKGVAQQCDASFQPEITAHRRLVQVFEYWELPEDDEDCEACFFPTVVLHDAASGDYEFQWFEGGDSLTPVGLIEVTVD